MGDERRLERDDAPPASSASRTSAETPDHGIAPSLAQQRAAASSPSSGAADQESGRQRVACAGRVDEAVDSAG